MKDSLIECCRFSIVAGNSFTLALTTEGEIFGWGRDDSGQIGVGSGLLNVNKMESLPTQISGFDQR